MISLTEKRILIGMPAELQRKLDREAKKRRISRSGLIRMVLSDWLEREGEKKRGRKPKEMR